MEAAIEMFEIGFSVLLGLVLGWLTVRWLPLSRPRLPRADDSSKGIDSGAILSGLAEGCEVEYWSFDPVLKELDAESFMLFYHFRKIRVPQRGLVLSGEPGVLEDDGTLLCIGRSDDLALALYFDPGTRRFHEVSDGRSVDYESIFDYLSVALADRRSS